MNKMTNLDASDLPTSQEELERWFDARFEEKMREREAAHVPSMSIIVTKGTLDWAYPPFILASTGAALGYDVNLFFTFYGLLLLKKELDLQVTPVGNPAMPMKMPYGPGWLQKLDLPVPNAFKANIPGFERAATSLMKTTFRNKGVASIEELRELSIEAGAQLYACQMTVDAFGFSQDEFIDETAGWIGAASYLPMSQKADITLFI